MEPGLEAGLAVSCAAAAQWYRALDGERLRAYVAIRFFGLWLDFGGSLSTSLLLRSFDVKVCGTFGDASGADVWAFGFGVGLPGL